MILTFRHCNTIVTTIGPMSRLLDCARRGDLGTVQLLLAEGTEASPTTTEAKFVSGIY
jgi:hypothetical protein